MVKHGSAVSRISQAQFNAILGVGNTVISLIIDTSNQSDQFECSKFVSSILFESLSTYKISVKFKVKRHDQVQPWGLTLNLSAIS